MPPSKLDWEIPIRVVVATYLGAFDYNARLVEMSP